MRKNVFQRLKVQIKIVLYTPFMQQKYPDGYRTDKNDFIKGFMQQNVFRRIAHKSI